jgi:SAM-dependent methyltransferase
MAAELSSTSVVTNRLSRRQLLLVAAAFGLGCNEVASTVGAGARDFGNFRGVYGDAQQRAAFRNFLVNVFHLYPEQDMDALIAEVSRSGASDGEVYAAIEGRLPEVTPVLGAVRYSLPALSKQKHEMANQTAELLGEVGTVEGYLEIGSHGRYLDELRNRVNVQGPVYTTAPVAPSYGVIDIVDRGQVSFVGGVVPWNDYAGFDGSGIEPGSVDLITIYIGIHHATEPARAPYLQSLRSLLSERGRIVIRDHDVTNDQMRALVGLAHDVFNVGTHETWATNEAERRNFYSLDYLVSLFESQGFRASPARLRQAGDPTLNTLLCFQKA